MTYDLKFFLPNNPCFTREKLAAYVKKTYKPKDLDTAVASILKRRKRRAPEERDFEEVRTGLYVATTAKQDAETVSWLPYMLPMMECEDSVIGYQAALWLHLGMPAPEKIRYYGNMQRGARTWTWAKKTFEAVDSDFQPGPSRHDGIPGWCLLPIEIAGCTINVRVTSLEQTLVDVLDGRLRRPRSPKPKTGEPAAQSVEPDESDDDAEITAPDGESIQLDADYLECWKALLEWHVPLGYQELRNYLKAVGSKMAMSKVGHFLEGHHEHFGLKLTHLYGLKPRLKSPRSWKIGVPGALNCRWLLRIPPPFQISPRADDSESIRPRLKGDAQLKDLDLLGRLHHEFGRAKFERGFRPGQEALIWDVLSGRDSIGIIPTGAGKSLTFQFPSLFLNGLTLVIMPLVALMNDQVRKATELGLRAAAYRPKGDGEAREATLQAIEEGTLNLLFLSPEALFPLVGSFEPLRRTVVQIVVDEVHTILTWGQDFRYALRRLNQLRLIWPNTPILALTATATQNEREEIMAELGFRADTKPYVGTTFRKTLFLQQQSCECPLDKLQAVIAFIKEQEELRGDALCGIVYCPTKRESEQVATALHKHFEGTLSDAVDCGQVLRELSKERKKGQKYKFVSLPEASRVQCYHAGLPYESRAQAERVFMTRPGTILVGTIAVGMGIDKDNVRYVVNFGPPSSINEYVQQIGRAGRDGKEAECVLLDTRQDWFIWKTRLDSEERKLDQTTHGSVHKDLPKQRKRLQQRRKDLAALDCLVHGSECFHQAIAGHYGEKLDTCKSRCQKCQHPQIHRIGWREYIESQKDRGTPLPDWETLPGNPCDDIDIDPPREDPYDLGPSDPMPEVQPEDEDIICIEE